MSQTPSSPNADASPVNPATLTELPAVARNVHLPCKKCECDRYFVVLAHTSSTSAKVKCEVCGATRTFKLKKEKASPPRRASAGKRAPGPGRASASARKTGPSSQDMWNELKTQIGTDQIVPYNMRSKYALANAINHPKFGLGFVTHATNEKIDVAFQEGGRSLVHNRT